MHLRPLLALLVAAGFASAVEIRESAVTVTEGGTTLTGHAYTPAGAKAGVLVVHEWWGRNAYADRRAKELAEEGYATIAVDLYGEAPSDDFPTAVRRSGAFYQDPSLFTRRLQPFLAALKATPGVEADHLAAIGYCFGGSAVLQAARAGLDLKAVVAFHPGLKTAAPATTTPKAAILVCHGGSDPFVPPADVAGFFQEMTAVKADWSMQVYGQAVHAFSNPTAGQGVTNVPEGVPFAQAVHHDAQAEIASGAALRVFLRDHLR